MRTPGMRRLSWFGMVLVISALGFALDVPAAGAATHSVSIVDFSFSPKAVDVQAGDTVTWTNNGSVPHTVTADDNSFNSGSLAPGASFSHTFSSAATVPYHCQFHGAAGGIGMSGTVVVAAAPATTTPRTAAPATTSPPVPGSTAPATTAPASTAAASVTSGTTAPQLAHTGAAGSTGMVGGAVLLMILGALAIAGGSWRRRSHSNR